MKKSHILIDLVVLFLMLAQMFYIFEGNLMHEILGIGLFLLIAVHAYQKRKERLPRRFS